MKLELMYRPVYYNANLTRSEYIEACVRLQPLYMSEGLDNLVDKLKLSKNVVEFRYLLHEIEKLLGSINQIEGD